MNVYLPFTARLPNTYQEVEYIASDGNQWIDTGYKPNINTDVETKFAIISKPNTQPYLYGCRNDGSYPNRYIFCLGSEYYNADNPSGNRLYANAYYQGNETRYSLSDVSINTIYTTKHNNTSFYLDGVLQSTFSSHSSLPINYNMYIFTGNIGGTRGNTIPLKLYSMVISENGTLIRKFVPCYRKSDNVIGLYDLVNNQFYTNAGTGTFSKGNDVTMTVLKNAYIGEYYKTFTIQRTEKYDMSSGWTYSDDATGLTAGSSDFDEFFGYYGCRLNSSGVETAKVLQSSPGVLDITQLGTLTSGDNVMIAFPRLGIKMSKSGTTVTLSITREPNKSGYQYYAHTKGSNAKDTLYLGAYEMVSGYKSLSGASPLGNLTRAGFRSGIKSTYDSSAGTNRYSQITIYARWFVNALYMMKYGNPNSQSVVGNGYTYGSSTTTTGGTNSKTSATYGTSATNQQIKLFGLEDWRGNINEWLDCCYYNGRTHLTVDKTNSIFQDSAYSTDLGATSNGWLAGISGSNDGMFMNVNTSGGGGSAYYTDRFNAGANYVILTSGTYGSANEIGVNFLTYTASTLANAQLGGRLMYL